MPRYPRTGYIGIGKQAAKGTAVAPTHFVRYTDKTSMTPDQGVEQVRFGGAGGEFVSWAYKQNYHPDGEFTLFARPDIAGLLFTLLLGTDTVSGTGPYTHTITPSAPGALPWCSIEQSIAGAVNRRIRDCRIREIQVQGKAGEPITLQVSFLGTTEDEVTPSAESYETDDPFLFWQGTYQLDGVDLAATITEFELTLTNVFDDSDQAADIVRADIPLIQRTIEGSVTVKFEDASWWKKVFYGGGAAPAKDVYRGALHVAQSYGSAASARGLAIDVPTVGLIRSVVELDPGSTDSQEVQINFAGLKGAGEFVTVAVTNGVQAAY